MARYGRGAQKSVKSAMHRRKKGTLRSGKGGKGRPGEKPETSDCDWAVGGAEEGGQGTWQENELSGRRDSLGGATPHVFL
jgi:hypothetical protein